MTLDGTVRVRIKMFLIHGDCPNKYSREEKRTEKIRKYQHLCFRLREKRSGLKVEVISKVITWMRRAGQNKVTERGPPRIRSVSKENAKNGIVGMRDSHKKKLSGLCILCVLDLLMTDVGS